MPMTKALYSFKQKIDYFNDDIDLIDVLIQNVKNDTLTENSSVYVMKYLNPKKHTHLSRRKNRYNSRMAIINHLKQTLYAAYIKDLYEEVTHFLKRILFMSLKNSSNPARVIGDHNITINAKELISLKSWDKVCEMVANNIFQHLENERSTIKLLDKINKKLGLKIIKQDIEDALPFLEIRHYLVHSDGKLPKEFTDKNKHISTKGKSGNYILLNYTTIKNARRAVCNLIEKYDEKVINNSLASAEDFHP